MNIKRFQKILCIVIMACICSLHSNVSANNKDTLTMLLPKFNIFLNSQLIDNSVSKYPLLVYKDITYFPMTWNYSQALGLQTEWNNKKGLKISKSDSINELKQDYSNNKVKNYHAKKVSFNIELNGKNIDNSKEQYPLLECNGVTYFPLTWEFAVKEFGWDLKWDNNSGLKIYCIKDNNLKNLVQIIDNTYLLSAYNFKGSITRDHDNSLESINGTHTMTNIANGYQIENNIKTSNNELFKVGLKNYGDGTKKWADQIVNGKEVTINLKLYGGNHPYMDITEFQITNSEIKFIKNIETVNETEKTKKYTITFKETSPYENTTYEYVVDIEKKLLKSYKKKSSTSNSHELAFEY